MAQHLHPGLTTAAVDVTMQFARPYARGGLLVLLQQPRDYHPWHKGIDAAIADCPNDATTQYYGHGLRGEVSLMDLWFCLPPSITEPLLKERSHQLQEMEDIVMAYIQVRSPTCILCMGDVSILSAAVFVLRQQEEESCVCSQEHP